MYFIYYWYYYYYCIEPPWFGNIMFKKQVNAGEEVVLECLSYGSPKPRVKWKKDSIPVIVDDRHVFTAEDQVLVIKKTNQDDSGTYECEISNSLGSKIQEVEVLIMTPCKDFIFFSLSLKLNYLKLSCVTKIDSYQSHP